MTLRTPLDVIDFDFLVFTPLSEREEGGVLIHRLSEFTFVFGFIKANPTQTPFPKEFEIFDEQLSGFEWTCPKEYQEAQLKRQITIDDLLKNWMKLQSILVESKIINFKHLKIHELNTYFPKEKVVLNPVKEEICLESQQVKEFPLNQSIFFYDRYGTQWLMNRINISKVYIIQASYNPEKKQLKLNSDIHIMDELLLSLFESYEEMEINELSLKDLIILKNKTMNYMIKNDLPKFLEFSFTTYRKQDIVEWMNPEKYYFNQVSE